jgi:hypothetical protein
VDQSDDRGSVARFIDDGRGLIVRSGIVASAVQFANPWHDEIGRFAPKGTGRKFDSETAADAVLNGEAVTVAGEDLADVILHFANLDRSINPDLTLVTTEGYPNLFSDLRDKMIPRSEMPQIPTSHFAEFETWLADAGIDVTYSSVDPRQLHATQSELNARITGSILQARRDGSYQDNRALPVSNDGYLLDGHHRWAAAAADTASCDGCLHVPIMTIDLPIEELLRVAHEFNDAHDIDRVDITQDRPRPIAAAAAIEPLPMATDEEDGVTDEDLADLVHGDGSAFPGRPQPAT